MLERAREPLEDPSPLSDCFRFDFLDLFFPLSNRKPVELSPSVSESAVGATNDLSVDPVTGRNTASGSDSGSVDGWT